MTPRLLKRRGFTLVELMVASAIAGMVSIYVISLMRTFMRHNLKSQRQSLAQQSILKVSDVFSRDCGDMTELLEAESGSIVYSMGSHRIPGFANNWMDPDEDDDAMVITTSAFNNQFVGYDLDDVDDDNNGNVDLRVRVRLNGTELFKETAVNQPFPAAGDWNNLTWVRGETLAKNVTKFEVTYFGSLAFLPAACDANNNGVITKGEVDAVACGGNGNNSLDLRQEREKISLLHVDLELDGNPGDASGLDGVVSNDFNLPLMPVVRRIP